jgi:thiol-disulfide isomerase/thioredoxin
LLAWACAPPPGANAKYPELAPTTFAESLDELVVALRPQGKPLVVNHWATWCVPCCDELPYVSSIAVKFAGRVDFIGVSWDKGRPDKPEEPIRASVDEVRRRTGASFPTIVAPAGIEALAKRLELLSEVAPQTFVFSRTGERLWAFEGEILQDEDKTAFEAAIEKALRN